MFYSLNNTPMRLGQGDVPPSPADGIASTIENIKAQLDKFFWVLLIVAVLVILFLAFKR